MTKPSETQLYNLVAKDAIREKLYTYCRSMDRTDVALGHTVFASESEVDYGPYFQGSGYAFVDRLSRPSNALVVTESHQLTNISIFVDGESAGSEAYILFTICIPGENGQLNLITGTGRFVDTWQLQNGDWLIIKRVFCQDFNRTESIETTPVLFNGSKTREDPSYKALNQ
jgi:hypothetical protein